MPTATNVTVGKPRTSGGVYIAPLGTTLPDDATTTLGSAFTELGYVSEDGLTNSNTPESDVIKAWGGDVVYTLQQGREDTFQFSLIESLKDEVLKVVYGSSHVSGSLSSGIAVESTNEDLGDYVWVFEMICRGGVLKRIVVPDGRVTEIGDISYTDNDVTGFEITLSCMATEDGVTHYEYIKTPASGTTGET